MYQLTEKVNRFRIGGGALINPGDAPKGCLAALGMLIHDIISQSRIPKETLLKLKEEGFLKCN